MFDRLFARLFKRRPASDPPRKAVAHGVPAAAPAPRERRTAAAAVTLVGIGAQRPLVSTSGALAGFEFHVNPGMATRLRRKEDEKAIHAFVANLLGAMRLCAGQGRVALAGLPALWLARGCSNDMFVPGMHLVLQADALFDDPAAAGKLADRLRSADIRVGWQPATDPGIRSPQGRPDFIPLRAPPHLQTQAWRDAIAATAQAWPDVPQVLLDLPSVDVMEAVLSPPVLFAACAVGTCTVPTRVQSLPPQARRLLQLLNRLVRDDDNALLANDIKSDAALSLRLLHYLNSAGATPGRQLDSIEQAVLVLGRDALYAWVAQMLVRMSPHRPASDALQAMALARARMLEFLARAAGLPSPGTLYLLGLASMLPLLLQCSIEDAADSMRLPPAAIEALRQRTGPWAPLLVLTEALERQDMTTAEPLAAPLGGLEGAVACWARAWLAN